jgi:hypothetical protein
VAAASELASPVFLAKDSYRARLWQTLRRLGRTPSAGCSQEEVGGVESGEWGRGTPGRASMRLYLLRVETHS